MVRYFSSKKIEEIKLSGLGSKTSLKGLSEIERIGIEGFLVVLKRQI